MRARPVSPAAEIRLQDGAGNGRSTRLRTLLILTLVALSSGIAVQAYFSAVQDARIDKARQQIRIISMAIDSYQAQKGGVFLPRTLDEVGHGNARDPWGRPYMYLNLRTGSGSAMDVAVAENRVGPPQNTTIPSVGGLFGIVPDVLSPKDKARVEKVMRLDRFEVPVNTDYDLFSMGPDGRSVPSITAEVSVDDLIRAGDGAFFGAATRL